MTNTMTAGVAASLAACALGACATPEAPEAAVGDVLTAQGYERTGETRTCLSTARIDHIDPITERLWLVETVGGEIYLNQVSPGCHEADSDLTYLFYETGTGRLCENQIVRVFGQAADIQRGACGLGEFERLRPVEAEAG